MRGLILFAVLSCSVFAADLRQQLMDADTAFAKATAERGLDGWLSWFADDAQINARPAPIQGKEALRKHYSKMFSQPGFAIRWNPLFAEASKDGTLGYTFGQAEVESRNAKGEVQKSDARYVSVWKRQKDGSWKVVTDIGN